VLARYRQRYAGEPLVRVGEDAPWVSAIAHAHHVDLGGFALSEDGRRLVVVATEDNLLKGAATQALQNLNLAFGLDEFAAIPTEAGA
jgi:N-acetyl-gamma-glutamylphosphate reductase